jgi:hypothetical protein
MTILRRCAVCAVSLALLILIPRAAHSQVQVLGGNPVLNITTGTATTGLASVSSTTASLRWRRQNVVCRMTVSVSCPGQRFTLKVLATNLSSGVAAPEVNLLNGMAATTVITNIPTGTPTWRTCTLRYTASATFEQGTSAELGNDAYAITYTLVAP